ncbi:hypothetical protein Hanom_Chr03g00180801 [Helianthus anomalus]
MRGLNCIKRLQCNLKRHLILSQSLLTRQLRSWTETAQSFNAGSLYARARPCAVRHFGSSPCVLMRGAASWLKSVHARVRHVTCEPIRARHTVAPYWLTLVRRARHRRTHAPCVQPRASCTRARMTATSCAASPTTWSLQPLCSTTRARSKIQRRLSSGDAKCKVRHQSATLRLIAHAARARVRVRVRVLRTLREDTSECFHETIRMESSTLNTHLSSISPPMWDKVLLSHLFQH